MRVIEPTRLLREAADVLEPVVDDVVVIGAAAIQVMLGVAEVVLTPTRDVDTAVADAAAGARVVGLLEGAAGMRRSELDYERPFTWVRDTEHGVGLKVQVVRPREPFISPPVSDLPTNSMIDERSNIARPSRSRTSRSGSGSGSPVQPLWWG